MTSTVFRGGSILTGRGREHADWAVMTGDVIRAIGTGDAPPADRVVDLEGGCLLPAFRDAHVHLPATGLYATGLDLRGERSAATILERFAERAATDAAVLFGGNFEDPLDGPLSGAELTRAVGARPALLARADMHSCVVSDELLAHLDLTGVEGVDRDANGRPSGYLREQAAARAWSWFDANLTPEQQRRAVTAAIERAYSKGIAEVHEMFVVEWRGWSSVELFAEIVHDVALDIVIFLGTDEVEKVKAMGVPRIGGDFFLDGSFGSHTAWMNEPYVSESPSGSSPTGVVYRSDEELYDFFMRSQRADLQVGVHAIGDAAIEQALRTWERVADEVGVAEVRDKAHRIEHFECATDDHIARAAHLDIGASVQPAFDRYWGGPDGLYASRIGPERAAAMNRFRTMVQAGLEVLVGSDSTVTPLDPFLGMAALREHHVPEQRIDAATALDLYARGMIGPTLQADLVLVDRDPLAVEPAELVATEVIGTWIGGLRVWPEDDAETM